MVTITLTNDQASLLLTEMLVDIEHFKQVTEFLSSDARDDDFLLKHSETALTSSALSMLYAHIIDDLGDGLMKEDYHAPDDVVRRVIDSYHEE